MTSYCTNILLSTLPLYWPWNKRPWLIFSRCLKLLVSGSLWGATSKFMRQCWMNCSRHLEWSTGHFFAQFKGSTSASPRNGMLKYLPYQWSNLALSLPYPRATLLTEEYSSLCQVSLLLLPPARRKILKWNTGYLRKLWAIHCWPRPVPLIK